MTCYIHPEREAQWTCAACGREICPECKVTLLERVYCNPCAEKMYLAALNRPSWFERHLNWSMAAGLFFSTVIILIGTFVLITISPDATEETLAVWTQIIGYVTSFLIMFPVAGWVVRKKSRNPWNVLWLVLPFGWVMILLLTNMSKAPQNNPPTIRPL